MASPFQARGIARDAFGVARASATFCFADGASFTLPLFDARTARILAALRQDGYVVAREARASATAPGGDA